MVSVLRVASQPTSKPYFVDFSVDLLVACTFGLSAWRLPDIGVTPQEPSKSLAYHVTSVNNMAAESDDAVVYSCSCDILT